MLFFIGVIPSISISIEVIFLLYFYRLIPECRKLVEKDSGKCCHVLSFFDLKTNRDIGCEVACYYREITNVMNAAHGGNQTHNNLPCIISRNLI